MFINCNYDKFFGYSYCRTCSPRTGYLLPCEETAQLLIAIQGDCTAAHCRANRICLSALQVT